MKPAPKITHIRIVLLASLFLALFGNFAFFENVLNIYPFTWSNIFFLISLFALLVCINAIFFSIFCFQKTVKPVVILVLLLSSQAAYFMDVYNIIIDDSMINNIIETDRYEYLDLISAKQIIYLVLLGLIPSIFVYKMQIVDTTTRGVIAKNIVLFSGSALLGIGLILTFSNYYASFFREHKPLRYYANPGYYLYSSAKYISGKFAGQAVEIQQIGVDAHIPDSDQSRELVIFVVGETARADHFSLNGYHKKTNPYLEREDVVSFDNVWSCGTSTAESVPCMFSLYSRSDFNTDKAKSVENLLDILLHAGVNVIWLDNNSDSKHVADRIPYQDFKSPDNNTVCDIECRDEGMLVNLQDYINSHPAGDIFIVLHQMGNHGPAYNKRYPIQFKKFTPTCETNQLDQCSQQEINNTYDNALLYTDYFLSKAIDLLKNNNSEFEAAMIYVSDHGESLGENNLYLHSLPYMIAPDAQTHIPLIMWFSDSIKEEIDLEEISKHKNRKLSHDNIFHTILGLLEISSDAYKEDMDIIRITQCDEDNCGRAVWIAD